MSEAEPILARDSARSAKNADAADVVIDLENRETKLDLTSPSAAPTAAPIPDVLRRQTVFDLDFVDAPSLEPVIASLLERRKPASPGQLPTVLTPNVDIMMQLQQSRARGAVEWEMFRRSQYCLPDGQPIILASQVLGRRLGARLTGSGLFASLWPQLVAGRRSVFVVASSDLIAARLTEEYPAAGATVAPMFEATDNTAVEQLADIVIEAATEQPLEFVLLGIGNPKDARIGAAILRNWPTELGRPPHILGLGGAASMYVGITKRAPSWVQRIGMEWFYRFCQEPRRLFRRYFVRDVGFVKLVWRQWRSGNNAGEEAVD